MVKQKKELILPIINAVIEKAKTKNIDAKVIENFTQICVNQELDALFYTNAEKINKEVKKIMELIEGKE